MHDDQIDLASETAEALIAQQFPELGSEPVVRLETAGTVNAIFRVGRDKAARFPLRYADPQAYADLLQREAKAMAELALHCPVPTPLSLAVGKPSLDFPMPWSVQTWIAGDVATPDGLEESDRFAMDLAALVASLRRAATGGRRFSGPGRGGSLGDHDAWVAECFERSAAILDVEPLRRLWARLRTVPAGGAEVMSHKDLIPFNLLVSGDRLVGVLDGGGFGPADPALDLVAAWHALDSERREVFRGALGVDEAEWLRGAAWAHEQAMGLVWYYQESNPPMAALGRTTVQRLCTDSSLKSLN